MGKEAILEKSHRPSPGVLSRYKNIIGQSEPMQHVYRLISKVATTDVNVLITGETGTGKELVTQMIHNENIRFLSRRQKIAMPLAISD